MADDSTFETTAKLAGVVAPSQISLNRGESAGIQLSDVVTLYRRVEVEDPDTGKKLGTVSFPRLRLKINLVSETFSIAVVTDREPVADGASSLSVRRLKRVTEDPLEAGGNFVLVERGEMAMIRRPGTAEKDEPSS